MEAEVLGTVASTETVTTAEGFRVGPFDDPDRYDIGQPVEAGAEGILYRGRLITPTSRLSLSVAVKALQPAYAARIDQWAARWRDQVELLRSLQIPGLVGVREGFVGPLPHRGGSETAGRNLYLVMNWVEGEALDHWVLRHRGVDVSNALKLLLPVAVAVDTMHAGQLTGSVPVVHRDIKPANILIGKGGSVLVDFGLTKGLSIGHPVGRAGTPGYIAPEVIAGGGYTPAADRYAFGATVFFLLTGRHPSTATNVTELRQFLESAPVGSGVSPELVDRVLAMLDPDPLRRPAALANWIAQLRQSSLDDEVLTVRLAPPAPARARRTRGRAATDGLASGSGSALSGGVGVAGAAATHSFVTGPRSSAIATTVGSGTASGSTGATAYGTFGTNGTLGTYGTLTGSSAPTGTGSGTAGVGTDFAANGSGDPHRRGGAHRAPYRAPQHVRQQRVLARRNAFGAVLALALIFVASDSGALAGTSRKVAISSAVRSPGGNGNGSNATGNQPPSNSNGPSGSTRTGPGELGFVPEAANPNGKALNLPTTTAPSAASCVKSFAPACGPLVWSPPVINKALTISFSYTPLHPRPNDLVTFTIVLDDPDDVNLTLDPANFGDPSAAGGAAAAPSNATGPTCQSPHGTWPPPRSPGHGHVTLTRTYRYTGAGSYKVQFTASSGTNNGPCGAPDPFANTVMGPSQTVVVDPTPPPPTTTTLPPPTTTVPATTTTVTTAVSVPPQGGGL